MRQIAIVRHGQSKKRGDDTAGLSKKGERRVGKTAEELKDFNAEKVFTSPLPRAEQSARVITQELKLADAETVSDLTEKGLEETEQDALKRILDAYAFVKAHSEGNVIVVSHGIVTKLLMKNVWGIDKELKRGSVIVLDMQ